MQVQFDISSPGQKRRTFIRDVPMEVWEGYRSLEKGADYVGFLGVRLNDPRFDCMPGWTMIVMPLEPS